MTKVWLLDLGVTTTRCVAVLGLAGCIWAAGCARTTTVILVRHGERNPVSATDGDPALTPAGHARALALSDTAGRAGISAIYASDLRRTQQTAAPLAALLNLTPRIVPYGSDPRQNARTIAADIMKNHAGKTVIVVGHSDTVPLIIEALGVVPTPTIGEAEFDHLFIVTKSRRGRPKLVRARYGT